MEIYSVEIKHIQFQHTFDIMGLLHSNITRRCTIQHAQVQTRRLFRRERVRLARWKEHVLSADRPLDQAVRP